MLDKDRIFAHFRTMSGLDEDAASPYRPLCQAAGQYVLTRLRSGVQLDRNMDRLCLAAAALAYGDWLELGGSRSSDQEFRVGEVVVRERSGGSTPRGGGLREHFLAGVAELLEPRFVIAGMGEGARPGEEGP